MHKMEDPPPYGDGVQDSITSETNLFLAKVTGARTSVFLLQIPSPGCQRIPSGPLCAAGASWGLFAEKIVFQDAFKNDQTLKGTTKTYH